MINKVVIKYFPVLVIVLSTLNLGYGQDQWTYDFNNGLFPIESGGKPLKVLGNKGQFLKEDIPNTDGLQRTVYQFEENSGLQFDNANTKGFLSKSFSIEVYFKMEKLDSWKRILDFKNRKSDFGSYIYEGKLNFYDYAMSEKAPVRINQYVHYVYSRDFDTKTIKMYINGQLKVEFQDPGTEGMLDGDQVLNLFQDDLIANHEASAGAVALIRLYDRVMTPVFIRRSYFSLKNPKQKEIIEEEEITESTIDKTEIEKEKPTKISNVTGKVFSGIDLKPINNADVNVRKQADNSLVAETKTIDGSFTFDLQPYESYTISASALGFNPKTISIKTFSHYEEIKSLFSLSESINHRPLTTIYFNQSDNKLDESSADKLKDIIQYFQKNQEQLLFLGGHTDNVGSFDKNLTLAEERIAICKEYLINHGIESSRIRSQSYGSSRPQTANSSESTRSNNRRVEIWINKDL